MSHEQILMDTLALAETLTALGIELPEQSQAAIAVRDAITHVVYQDDPAGQLATDILAGTITAEDAPDRAMAALDALARHDHVTALSTAMQLPHSRAIRNPIIAGHDNLLDQLRPRFTASAEALGKAKSVPVDLSAELAVDLPTKQLDLWREIPAHAGQLGAVRTGALELARYNDRAKYVPDFCWFVADSDDSPEAASLYAEQDGRGEPWHRLVTKGHTLRLATVDEAINAASRHAERVAEGERKADEQVAVLRRSPLEQSRIDADRANLARLR
jgi:hypothetical protein